MSSTSQPSQAFAQASSSQGPAQSSWSGDMDDVAFGCECADPSLQIASWGVESGDVQAAAVSS